MHRLSTAVLVVLCALVLNACQNKQQTQAPAPVDSAPASTVPSDSVSAAPTRAVADRKTADACGCPEMPVVGTADHPTPGTARYELSSNDIQAMFSNRDELYGGDWNLGLMSLAHDIDPDAHLGIGASPPAPTHETEITEGGVSARLVGQKAAIARSPSRVRYISEPIWTVALLIHTIARSNKYGETTKGVRENSLAISQFLMATLAKVPVSPDAKNRMLVGFSSNARWALLVDLERASPYRTLGSPDTAPSPGELTLTNNDLTNAALDVLSWKDAKGRSHDLDGASFVSYGTAHSQGGGRSGDIASDLLELASMRSELGAPTKPGSEEDAIACKAYNILLRMATGGKFSQALYATVVNYMPRPAPPTDRMNEAWRQGYPFAGAHYQAALSLLVATGFSASEGRGDAHGLMNLGVSTDRSGGSAAQRSAIVEVLRALGAHGNGYDAGADAFQAEVTSGFQRIAESIQSGGGYPELRDFLAKWNATQAVAGGSNRAPRAPLAACAKPQAGRAFLVMRPRRVDGRGPSEDAQASVDFANQKIGIESRAHKLWLGNGGDSPLLVNKVELSKNSAFRIDDRACTAEAIAPLAHCEISVFFKPTRDDYVHESAKVLSNGGAPQVVLMEGTGTSRDLAPGSVERSQNHIAFRYYSSDKTFGTFMKHGACENIKVVGWHAILPKSEFMTLQGQVVENHVASDDFTGVHFAQDYNFFVYPDNAYRRIMAMPGNFEEGDPYELGRIEVEWERRRTDGAKELAAGFPQWAWPAQGDRVRLEGTWIYDCGHHASGPDGYRSEIHPPRFALTYRNNALAEMGGVDGRLGSFHRGPDGLTWATRADVFGSTFGGDAVWSEGHDDQDKWYQDLGGRSFTFTVLAPPKPSPDAQLAYWQCDHLVAGDCAREGLPETDTPVAGSARPGVYISPLPDSAPVAGYKVEVRMPNSYVPPSRLVVVGKTIWVGWKNIDPKTRDAIGPHVRNYAVTVKHVNIVENLSFAPQTHWTMWAYANEHAAPLFAGDGETNLGEPLRIVHAGSQFDASELSNPVFRGSLVDEQPLRLKILGAKYNTTANAEAGTADFRFFGSGLANIVKPMNPDRVNGFPLDERCPKAGCYDAAVEINISPAP